MSEQYPRGSAQCSDGGAIMDVKSCRRLCAALVGLTGPQLKELRVAHRWLGARMQADLFIDDRHCGGRNPFASLFPPGRPRHVLRSSPLMRSVGQGARSRQDVDLALASEDHSFPRGLRRCQPRRGSRSGRKVLPGVPQWLARVGHHLDVSIRRAGRGNEVEEGLHRLCIDGG